MVNSEWKKRQLKGDRKEETEYLGFSFQVSAFRNGTNKTNKTNKTN